MEKNYTQEEIQNLATLLASAEPDTWNIAIQLAKNSNATKDRSFATLLFTCAYFDLETKKRQESKKILKKLSPELLELGKGKFNAKVIKSDLLSMEEPFQAALQEIMIHPSIDKKVAFAFLLASYRNKGFASKWVEVMAMKMEAYPPLEFWKRYFKEVGSVSMIIGIGMSDVPEIKGREIRFPSHLSDIPFTAKLLEGLDLDRVELLVLNTCLDENLKLILDEPKFKNLKYICLSIKGCSGLPESIGNWANLRQVRLDCCGLKALPNAIRNWQKLVLLNIIANKVQKLPDGFFDLKNLKFLFMSSNEIEEIPEQLKQLSQLEIFDVTKNQLKKLPDVFDHLPNIFSLRIGEQAITEIPETIGSLTKIKSFSPGIKGLTKIPNLYNWPKVQQVSIYESHIGHMPASMCNISELFELDFHANGVTVLPENIGNLKKLRTVNLSHNPIKKLPASFVKLQRLHQLDLSYNEHLDLENLVFIMNQCPYLRRLRVGSKQMKRIPTILSKLKYVRTLHIITGDFIAEIPLEFSNMEQLKHLETSPNLLSKQRARELNKMFINKSVISIKALRTDEEINDFLKHNKEVKKEQEREKNTALENKIKESLVKKVAEKKKNPLFQKITDWFNK